MSGRVSPASATSFSDCAHSALRSAPSPSVQGSRPVWGLLVWGSNPVSHTLARLVGRGDVAVAKVAAGRDAVCEARVDARRGALRHVLIRVGVRLWMWV